MVQKAASANIQILFCYVRRDFTGVGISREKQYRLSVLPQWQGNALHPRLSTVGTATALLANDHLSVRPIRPLAVVYNIA